MFCRIRSLLRPAAPARHLNFVPLCRLPAGAPETWHRCPTMILSDTAYDRLHEFLQANLEGRWSLMPQDDDGLDQYDVLLEIKTEADLIDLFRVTMGMKPAEAHRPSSELPAC
jgi:hypothetical protein